MERKLKFKVGDKVKVIATKKKQLARICITLEFCNDDFYYIEEINSKCIDFLPYVLSNGYHLPEEYLDYAD